MVVFGMTSIFSSTPTIITVKLSWSASVKLWFLGQGYHNHVEKDVIVVLEDEKL